jgi:hypothetical protein
MKITALNLNISLMDPAISKLDIFHEKAYGKQAVKQRPA